MIQRLFPAIIFSIVAIAIVQLISLSFSKTYRSIEENIKKPYAQAQELYDQSVLEN